MPLHLHFTDKECATSVGRVMALQRASVELVVHAQRLASGEVKPSTTTTTAKARAVRPRSPNSHHRRSPSTHRGTAAPVGGAAASAHP